MSDLRIEGGPHNFSLASGSAVKPNVLFKRGCECEQTAISSAWSDPLHVALW